jgi:hypothetical protein
MNTTQFEEYIKQNINSDLYVEPTNLEDRKRVMINWPGKNPIYICAIPAGEIKSEPDNGYQDHSGGRYPSLPEIESKIKNFIQKLPNNLDLYE